MRGLFIAKSDGQLMITSLEKILIFGEEREEEKQSILMTLIVGPIRS